MQNECLSRSNANSVFIFPNTLYGKAPKWGNMFYGIVISKAEHKKSSKNNNYILEYSVCL